MHGRGSLGVTPLGLAAEWGHLSTAALLNQQGASVNATDEDGQTPSNECHLEPSFSVVAGPEGERDLCKTGNPAERPTILTNRSFAFVKGSFGR